MLQVMGVTHRVDNPIRVEQEISPGSLLFSGMQHVEVVVEYNTLETVLTHRIVTTSESTPFLGTRQHGNPSNNGNRALRTSERNALFNQMLCNFVARPLIYHRYLMSSEEYSTCGMY